MKDNTGPDPGRGGVDSLVGDQRTRGRGRGRAEDGWTTHEGGLAVLGHGAFDEAYEERGSGVEGW
jgi:hypothetical protein